MVPPVAKTDIEATLAEAVVTASQAPLLLLDEVFAVVAVSETLCAAFGVEAAEVLGRPVFAMDGGAWDLPKLRSLLSAMLTGRDGIADYRLDLKRGEAPPRRLALGCVRLVSSD